jgi:hypothetical protein
LRCELVELVDHPNDLMRGLDLSQGAIIHHHFVTWFPSFFNSGRDAGERLKEKCRDPTADSIRVCTRSNRGQELKRFLKSA